jgi:hypothetical protein
LDQLAAAVVAVVGAAIEEEDGVEAKSRFDERLEGGDADDDDAGYADCCIDAEKIAMTQGKEQKQGTTRK